MKMATANHDYHIDHLGLADRDFSGMRLVVFHGRSGSGKSTAMEYLYRHCAAFRDRAVSRVSGGPVEWNAVGDGLEQLVLIDELLVLRDLPALARLLRRGHTVLAASHLPAILTAALVPARARLQFATDVDPGKIARYLRHRGIGFSDAAVTRYCRRFGATFTDVDIILERYPGADFDRSLEQFLRHCRLELTPATN